MVVCPADESLSLSHFAPIVQVASLTRSPIPLAFINGPADPVSGRHMYEEFILQVPNAKAFLLGDGVGHYPQLEAPDQVISAYFTFLDGL
jgi:pimeloyl-ACP methyl ester carboxylesterase